MPGTLSILLALAAAAGPVLLALWAARRGRHTPWPLVALQAAAVLLAALALARPAMPIGRQAHRPYMVLRDVSASVRGQDANVALPPELPRELFDFASGVAPAGGALSADATLLAPALQLVHARRGEIAGVILRTDGNFADDWRAAAAALAQDGVGVLISPLDSPPPDARISGFAARRTSEGAVELTVTVAANDLARRTLSVWRDLGGREPDVRLLERRLDLQGGLPAALRVTDANAPAASAASYAARLSAGDALPENDVAHAIVAPRVRRFALIGDGALGAAALGAALGAQAVALPAAQAPASAAGWADFAAVVLQDPCGTLLPPPSRAALSDYVAAGGGLVLIGAAPHASPADRDDPLTRAAALHADPYQRKPLRVVLLLDASGSMAEAAAGAGGTKFDQAIEAVASLRRHLTPADSLAVIAFSDSARCVYDSGPREPDFAALRQALRAVRPAGPTDAEKALALAAASPAVAGRDGLVLLVSDLQARLERPDVLAKSLRDAKLALGVIAIAPAAPGAPAPPAPASPAPAPGAPAAPALAPASPAAPHDLEQLARALGAPPVVYRQNLQGLAELFARFLTRARGSAVAAGSFAAAASPDAPFDIPANLPVVQSYLLSAAQPAAQTLARLAPNSDPLLACMHFGMGRSVALALDPRADANPAWQTAGALSTLAARAAAWAAAPAGDPRFTGDATLTDSALHLAIDAADANGPINNLQLRAVLADAAPAPPTTFDLLQTSPGRYEARAPAPRAAAVLAVHLAAQGDAPAIWQAALPHMPPREFAALGADWDALRELATRSRGHIVSRSQLASLAPQLLRHARTDLWPLLAASAAALMLLEWSLARTHRKPRRV